jgi:Xaa-Pro aminopeptidase
MTQTTLSLYAKRRAQLAAQLGEAVSPSFPRRWSEPVTRDSDFLTDTTGYFYYLSGFSEPNAWLAIDAQGQMLFCQPKDLEREIGMVTGCVLMRRSMHLALQAAYSVSELDQQMPNCWRTSKPVWYPFATHKGLVTVSTVGSRGACPCALWCAVPGATM